MAEIRDENTRIKPREMLSIVRKAFSVSLKTKSSFSFFISILGFVFAFFPALTSYVLGIFTNEIQLLSTGANDKADRALILLIILLSLHIIKITYNYVKNYTFICDSVRTNKYLTRKVLECVCRVKYKYVENYDKFLEKISFINSYAGVRVAGSIQTVIVWLQNLLTFASVVYLLWNVNPLIVAILLVASIPSVVLSYLQKDEDYRYKVKWMVDGAKSMHAFAMATRDSNINEVRQYRIFPYLKQRWRNLAESYKSKKQKLTKKHVIYNSISDVIRNAVYIAVLLVCAYEIYRNPLIGLGVFTLTYSLSKQLQSITATILFQAAQFFSDIKYMKDFFDLDNLEYDKIDKSATAISDADIEFKNVSFTYPGSDSPVLNNINVKIKHGEKIAIVGENGSGKTTFLNLLCGMYEPNCGTISMGNKNINDNISAVRKSISVVFQDFSKYEATIRHNIAVSDPHRQATDEEILDMINLCDLASAIENQPEGLNEEIGLFSQHGNNLSGGQWQKLTIARALYRNKANIMILDEPTSALDPISEANIYRNFAELTGDKTTILVSHRLGITSIVDRILVFKEGQIIESGSHGELMNNNGYYAEMYRAQAQWYEMKQ